MFFSCGFRLPWWMAALFPVLTAAGVERYELPTGGDKKVYYFAEHDINSGNKDLEYAVIFIHSASGGARDRASFLRARFAGKKQVFCVAPFFPENKTCPADERGKVLLWGGKNNWRGGDNALNGDHSSNFAIIDKIYAALSDPQLYPALKQITLVGFSAGGQCVNRYIAVGRMPLKRQVKTRFVVASPSTYLYVDEMRMVNGTFRKPDAEVATYDCWHTGLHDMVEYCQGITREQVMANLAARETWYFCGAKDTGKKLLVVTPAAMLQGENRYDRFLTYQKYIARFPQWQKMCKFVPVPKIAHAASVLLYKHLLIKLICGGE